MPGKVKARVLAARNLPVMDRSSDTTDAFAELKLADTTYKTDVCRKTLHPTWNSDWFRFDADDRELQDEPLQIRIMDYDTYSANDAIGKVYIDLNPLLLRADEATQSSRVAGQQQIMLSGWLPIFDTMHGVRGEVNVQVKVELFSDLNKFRTSSCGVLFFCTSGVPEGYKMQCINGFVEKIVINDDPEYQWIDKIRTQRASNEARQALFMKLSNEVQRKIGLMALELGGNAVVGYQQKFDLEGDTGIVVRAIGTAVTLSKLSMHEMQQTSDSVPTKESAASNADAKAGRNSRHASGESDTGCSPKSRPDNCSSTMPPFALLTAKFSNRVGVVQEGLELIEYPFITMKTFPIGFIQRLGGLVSCRSVKLLDSELEDNKMLRDGWWQEIRQEIRSHARCLGCNMVVGYAEDTVIWEDVVVLCASGTAAVGNLNFMLDFEAVGMFGPPYLASSNAKPSNNSNGHNKGDQPAGNETCSLVHLPANENSLPFACRVSRCSCCAKGQVPDVLFATVEPPKGQLDISGRGCLLQAKVLRLKRDLKGENNAKEISDALPFIEYEIHRQLINKLKVKGMNAIFGLRIHLSISDRAMVATATATGVRLVALAPPSPPKLVITNSNPGRHRNDSHYLDRMQKRLEEKIAENVKYYGLYDGGEHIDCDARPDAKKSDFEEIDNIELEFEPATEQEMLAGNKDTCVLEIDDSEDADIVDSLMDRFPPPEIQVFSTEELVGIAPGHVVKCSQMFSQVWRGKIHPTTKDLAKCCQKLMSAVFFKMRRLKPCLINQLSFKADLDEENELQVSIYGTAISLAHSGRTRQEVNSEDSPTHVSHKISTRTLSKSAKHQFYAAAKDNGAIVITPLTYIPGAKIDKYLGNLNFFLIRETSSLREAGGLSSFVQSFIIEIHSIVRSHVSALGGNALVSYFMSEFVVMHSPHKNQAQCLIHVGGDSVQVAYLPI